MPDNASRRGAVDMGMPLMILAFFVIAGFMYWLNGQAASERALRIVEDTATVVDDNPGGVTTIAAADIQMDATAFEGQEIRLESMNVASLLGSQGFWIDMPNGNPFLVSMSADVMAEGAPIGMGSSATIIGVIHLMGDSTLAAWAEAATVSETDLIVAEFATHYLEASRIDLADSGGDSGGNQQ